jgi:hypothetical protein
MSSTRTAALRVALTTTLCAAVSLTLMATTAPTGAVAKTSPRATCADKLCKRDRANTPSCWRFSSRDRVARCFIRRAARHYGQPASQALYVARRESRYNWRVTNRSSGAAGLFQFMPRTWQSTPYRHHSAYHPKWASLAAMWMWKRGYASHWSL